MSAIGLWLAMSAITKEFCGGETDPAPRDGGQTTGSDGVITNPLPHPHGTKIAVQRGKPKGKSTVTFPDGASTSTTIP